MGEDPTLELGEIVVNAEEMEEEEIKPKRETSFKVPAAKAEQVEDEESDKSNTCLGVFGLSNETTQKDLYDHFGKFGDVEHVHLIVDSRTQISKGFGFITFEAHEDAAYARQKTNGGRLHKRMIRVDFSKTRGPKPRTPGVYKGPAKWGGALAEQKENLPVIPDYFHNIRKKSKPYRIEEEPDYQPEEKSESSSSESSDTETSDSDSSDSDSSDTMVQSERGSQSTASRRHKKQTDNSSLRTFSTRDDNSTIDSTLVTPSYTATHDDDDSTIPNMKINLHDDD